MIRRSLVILATCATIAAALQPGPAAAAKRGAQQPSGIQDTYCLQSRQWGYPGNCQFSTFEQCQATAIGTDASCGINPMKAYNAQARDPRVDYGRRW